MILQMLVFGDYLVQSLAHEQSTYVESFEAASNYVHAFQIQHNQTMEAWLYLGAPTGSSLVERVCREKRKDISNAIARVWPDGSVTDAVTGNHILRAIGETPFLRAMREEA